MVRTVTQHRASRAQDFSRPSVSCCLIFRHPSHHWYLQHDTVQIASDGGRVCRPLIICDKGVPRVKDEHLKVGPTAGPAGAVHLSDAEWSSAQCASGVQATMLGSAC